MLLNSTTLWIVLAPVTTLDLKRCLIVPVILRVVGKIVPSPLALIVILATIIVTGVGGRAIISYDKLPMLRSDDTILISATSATIVPVTYAVAFNWIKVVVGTVPVVIKVLIFEQGGVCATPIQKAQ